MEFSEPRLEGGGVLFFCGERFSEIEAIRREARLRGSYHPPEDWIASKMVWQNAGQLLPYHLRTITPEIACHSSHNALRRALAIPDVGIGWSAGVVSTAQSIAARGGFRDDI